MNRFPRILVLNGGDAKLEPAVIADFEKWIAMGAADPRTLPPSVAEIEKATSWETVQ